MLATASTPLRETTGGFHLVDQYLAILPKSLWILFEKIYVSIGRVVNHLDQAFGDSRIVGA